MRAFLLFAVAVACASCRAEVNAQLDEQQANEVIVALGEAGIDAEKEAANLGHYAVTVPRASLARALGVLHAGALPRQPRVGLEIIGQGDSLVPAFVTEQAQLARGLAGELEKTLGSLCHVERANVQLAFADTETALLAAPRPRIEHATVVLRVTAPIDEAIIKKLVTNVVPSLHDSDIIVIAEPTVAATRAAPVERVGPFFVAAQSRGPLQRTLVGGLLLLLVLGILLVVQARRTVDK